MIGKIVIIAILGILVAGLWLLFGPNSTLKNTLNTVESVIDEPMQSETKQE